MFSAVRLRNLNLPARRSVVTVIDAMVLLNNSSNPPRTHNSHASLDRSWFDGPGS